MKVSVLFARKDSIYKELPNCDVWDIDRNAMLWPGGNSIIAHPPCRLWGRLRKFSNAPESEKDTGRFAVQMVRKWGGVLEHPAGSLLWKDQNLPLPGQFDNYNGYTLAAPQIWWGHKANKSTWFYIVGFSGSLSIPFTLAYPSHVVKTSKKRNRLPYLSHSDRERTPIKLAYWLFDLASRCEILSDVDFSIPTD